MVARVTISPHHPSTTTSLTVKIYFLRLTTFVHHPENLHVLDAGITVYMVESLQCRIPGGRTVVDLNNQHERMFNRMRRQSMRDLPRGSVWNGLLETTRYQSSERKGNMFLLLCIAESADGELILRHHLNYMNKHWKQWKELLKLYLSM